MIPDWLAGNPWAVWLALAAVLAVLEMFTLDLTLLMLSIGAVAGLITSLFLPDALWVQIVVSAVAALACLALVRPNILKRLPQGAGYRSAVDSLVGSAGVTTRAVTASDGEVKVQGETWSARSYDGDPIAADVEVDVLAIDGVFALVYPRNRSLT